MPGLSTSARKVQECLEKMGFQLAVVEIPQGTRTSADAAKAVGSSLGQIAKTIVFEGRSSHRPVLVIASGSNRVNEARIEELIGEPVVKASAEFVRKATGFVIGGVPPIGHAESTTIFIDEDLLQYAEIWAAAGTPYAVFKLAPGDLIKMTGGSVTRTKSSIDQ